MTQFTDTQIQLNVQNPNNYTNNNEYIGYQHWSNGAPTPAGTGTTATNNKYSSYGKFMNCMEIDWGGATTMSNFTNININNIMNNGITTSDELLGVVFWMWNQVNSGETPPAPTTRYNITWNGNGATTAASGGSSQVDQGQTVTLPTTNPKREYSLTWNGNGATTAASGGSSKMEYTFNKWWTLSSGGSEVTNATIPTGNSTYYAHWTPKAITLPSITPIREYTITWNVNGGSGNISGGTAKVTYQFNKWTNASSGGTEITTSTEAVSNSTYYAQWNTPTGNLQLPSGTLTKNDYTFSGWATTSSATTSNVSTSTTLASISENKTYYAVWTRAGQEPEPSTNYWCAVCIPRTNPDEQPISGNDTILDIVNNKHDYGQYGLMWDSNQLHPISNNELNQEIVTDINYDEVGPYDAYWHVYLQDIPNKTWHAYASDMSTPDASQTQYNTKVIINNKEFVHFRTGGSRNDQTNLCYKAI